MKNKSIAAAVCLFVALMVVSTLCVSCGTGALDQSKQDKLDAALQKTFKAGGPPGMMFGVWTPEGSWMKAVGEADIESGRALDTTDRFRIASVTKTFTAEVVLQLVDEKKIGLDDSVDRYIPGIPDGDKITIRMLLNHTAGLYDLDDDNLMGEIQKNPLRKWKPRELLDYALSHPPDFAPGERMEYSNTNYIVLGMIIEKVTGSRYEEEVRARLIEPLGLNNTGFPTGPDLTGSYSKGYTPGIVVGKPDQELVDVSTMDMSWDWAAGAMYSTLDDLHVWVDAYVEGKLISPDTHKEQEQFVPWTSISEGLGINVGYGLGMTDLGGLYGHGGNDPGYNTVMYYLPKQKAAFVGFNNVLPGPTEAKSAAMQLQQMLFDSADILYPGVIEKHPK
jgi:D-alanyl-D-alanine carboxypeptidase